MMPTPGGTLWVYDRTSLKWTNLGSAAVSPDSDWDYIQPSWDPWFSDSAQLTFFSGSNLVVSSPDGAKKRVLWAADRPAGLAVPSPNGASIAYVTFQSRPMKSRADLKFWGSASISIISTADGGDPRTLTPADPDTTMVRRWLGDSSLVFDRIGENLLAMHARIWKVAVH